MTLRHHLPAAVAILGLGLTTSCLLAGYEPIGADPDVMYRSLKTELVRALARGTLPFWSSRLGLGVPLVAESHVAAFYPWNVFVYRILDLFWAFRISMWIHQIATAAAMYLYARCLGLERWGSAFAAVSFSLCGFASSHSGHEPLYLIMPWLPVCLIATDRFVASGRIGWLAVLALAWGLQLTIGHFQIQMWTAGLSLLTGTWKTRVEGRPRWRIPAIAAALATGMAIASVQLVLTWELTRIAGFSRPYEQLASYLFPPGIWMQPVLPSLFANVPVRKLDDYLATLTTTAVESTFYIGSIPLVLAMVGMVDTSDRRRFRVWRLLVVVSLVLATMPAWFPTGYWLLTYLPGLGWFRCPGRYTLLTSLGLAILAGHGLDRAIRSNRFYAGVSIAAVFGISAVAWTIAQLNTPAFRASFGPSDPTLRIAVASGCFAAAVILALLCRWKWVASWVLVVVTTIELAALYHLGPVEWNWSVAYPEKSPITQQLLKQTDVGLIAGRCSNLVVRLGLTCAYPYLGITPPPPNYLLEQATFAQGSTTPELAALFVRFGVTHAVWLETDVIPRSQTVFVARDPVLDGLLEPHRTTRPIPPWKIVKYDDHWPSAWVSRKVKVLDGWAEMLPSLFNVKNQDEALYDRHDAPPGSASPRASVASITNQDETSVTVEHDGSCDLGIRRIHYPGWTYAINGGPPRPVLKANGGLQAVRLEGHGPSRVTFAYRPTNLRSATLVSLFSLGGTLLALSSFVWPKKRD